MPIRDARGLAEMGIPVRRFALYGAVLDIILVLSFSIPALIIVARKSDDWLGIFVSVVLVLMGVANTGAFAALLWFDGLKTTHDADGDTTLEGAIGDQTALYGLITSARDLHLTLMAVEQRTTTTESDPLAPPLTRVILDRVGGLRKKPHRSTSIVE